MAETPIRSRINLVNREGCNETTALHFACKNDSTEIAECLLEHEADINCLNSNGQSPLIVATERNNVEIVKLLLKKKADKNIIDKDGKSALSKAITRENLDIVKLLCDKNAIINENQISQGIIAAITQDRADIAKILTSHGGDVNSFCREKNMTVLMFAANIPNMEWVKEIVSSKQVNLDFVDQFGNTVLMRLLKKIKEMEHTSPNPLKLVENNPKYTTCIDLVTFLVNKGSDLNVANNEGNTVLHFAAEIVLESVLNILIKKICPNQYLEPRVKKARTSDFNTANSAVDVLNNMKITPLHLAVANKNLKNVKLLVEAGANVNLKYME